MPRIQGLAESGLLNSNTLVKNAEGYVFSFTVSWEGAAVGAKCYLRDGSAVTDAIEEVFIFPTANGTITKEWVQGKHFATGIFFDKGSAANVYASLTYK